MTRKEARLQGLVTYDPEQPCSRGHNARKNTKSGRCVDCNREDVGKWYRDQAAKKLIEQVAY